MFPQTLNSDPLYDGQPSRTNKWMKIQTISIFGILSHICYWSNVSKIILSIYPGKDAFKCCKYCGLLFVAPDLFPFNICRTFDTYINILNISFSFWVSSSQLNSFAFNYCLSFEALSWTDSFQFVSESSFLLFSWLSPSSSITLGCSSARTWFVRTIHFVGL